LQFKPARWRKVQVQAPACASASSSSVVEKNNRDRNFLALGARPFFCPATHDFGPMVIALLLGIFLEGFPSGGGGGGGNCDGTWMLGSNDAADMKQVHSARRLRNERGVYEGVFLGLGE
jgi:hypothetical protein